MEVTALFIALLSGLTWGAADFWGGLLSRRTAPYTVTLWSQLGGAIALAVVVASVRPGWSTAGFLTGMLAGACGGSALAAFYRALATGTMSIVAPIAACGVVLPVAWSIIRGDGISTVTAFGMAVCFIGIVVVSIHPQPEDPTSAVAHRAAHRRVIALSVASAVGFGGFFAFLDEAAVAAGSSPLLAISGSRTGSLLVLLTAGAVLRLRLAPPSKPLVIPVIFVGVLDTTANGLFAWASTRGDLGVVSLLSSTYPVATVLLAWVVLKERLNRLQALGVACALVGTLILAT